MANVTKVAQSATFPIPSSQGMQTSFSPDDKLIAISTGSNNPSLYVYDFDASTGVVGSQLTNPSSQPVNWCRDLMWTPNCKYLLMRTGTKAITGYPVDTTTKIIGEAIPDPSTPLPFPAPNCVDISPNGKWLMLGSIGSSTTQARIYIMGFDQDRGQFGSLVSNITPIAGMNYSYTKIKFSPDGKYVVLCYNNVAPYFRVFHFNQDTGELGAEIPSPISGIPNHATDADFSHDLEFLAITHYNSPYVTVYNFDPVNGVIGEKLSNPSQLPSPKVGSGFASGVEFSKYSQYLTVSQPHDTEAFIYYQFNNIEGTIGEKLAVTGHHSGSSGSINGFTVKLSNNGRFLVNTSPNWSYVGIFKLPSEADGNILFKNPSTGEYYSDGQGVLLNMFSAGTVVAGQTTPAYQIIIENRLKYSVANVEVFTDSIDPNFNIEFSYSNTPFIPEEKLLIGGTLTRGATRSFYVRVVTPENATGGGEFNIKVSATEV